MNMIRKHKCQDGRIIKQRLYYIEPMLSVWCPERSCVFCKNCDDILYDFTNGPYMFHCLKDPTGEMILTERGACGECEYFNDNWEEIEKRNNEIISVIEKSKKLESNKDYKKFINEFHSAVSDTILYGEEYAKAKHEDKLKELSVGFSKAWNNV